MVGEHYLHSYYAPTSGTDTSPALAAFSVTFVSVCKAQSLDSTPAWKSVGWVTSICSLVQPFLVINTQQLHSEKSIIGPILTHYWIRMISSLVGNMGNSIGSMI